MERWGHQAVLHDGQKRGLAGSADSWESLLIFYFWTLQDDWGLLWNHLPGVRGQHGRVKDSLNSCSTIIHTGATAEGKMAGGRGRILLAQLGLVHMYASAAACAIVSQGHDGKVCQREKEAISRGSFGALPHKRSSAEL